MNYNVYNLILIIIVIFLPHYDNWKKISGGAKLSCDTPVPQQGVSPQDGH